MASTPIDNMRAAPNTELAERKQHISSLLMSPRVKENLAKIVGKTLDPERLLRLTVFACNKTPLLLQCTPQSILGATMLSAVFNLEPNTPAGQAYLIPYGKRAYKNGKWVVDKYECQFQFGYKGLHTLAHRAGFRVSASEIRENDYLDYMEGSEAFFKYRKALTRRGPLIGAFSFMKVSDHEHMATVLPLDKVLEIRNKSETYRQLAAAIGYAKDDKARVRAEKKLAETPWVLWEDEMFSKTAMKYQITRAPVFDQGNTIVSSATAIDNASEAGVIDMDAFVEPDAVMDAANGMIATRDPEDDGEEPTETAEPERQQGNAPEIGRGTVTPPKEQPKEQAKEQPKEEPKEESKHSKKAAAPIVEHEPEPETRKQPTRAARQADEPPNSPPPAGAEEEGLFGSME